MLESNAKAQEARAAHLPAVVVDAIPAEEQPSQAPQATTTDGQNQSPGPAIYILLLA